MAGGALDLAPAAVGDSVAVVRHLQHARDPVSLHPVAPNPGRSHHRGAHSLRVRGVRELLAHISGRP
jgi:hypothetical protein